MTFPPEQPGFAPDLATPQPPTPPRPSDTGRSSAGRLLALAVAALVGAFASRCLSSEPEAPPPVQQVVRQTPDVITAIRGLSRLESTNFHVERVVDLRDQHSVLFGFTTADDAILLVASGDVVAGVDLAKLRPEDIVVDEATRRVRITLPAPEIFSARLDNDRTFVYERRTDVMARRSPTLETRARQEAERTMRAAALEAGVLDRAGTEARATVGTLVRGLGFADVVVTLRTDESR